MANVLGRYFIEFAIPALILLWVGGHVIRFWYFRIFPRTVRNIKNIDKASDKYDKDLK